MDKQSMVLGIVEAGAASAAVGDEWRDAVLAPALGTLPGAQRVARYRELNNPRTLASVDLPSAPDPELIWSRVPNPPPGLALSTCIARQIGEQRRGDVVGDARDVPLLYAVVFAVPEDRHAEFDDWYDTEHVPMLLRCQYWSMTRRFRLTSRPARPATHLALHYLSDVRALRSPERTAARGTLWRARLSREPWFKGTYTVYLQEDSWPISPADRPA